MHHRSRTILALPALFASLLIAIDAVPVSPAISMERRPLWEACRAALDAASGMSVEMLASRIDGGGLAGAALVEAYTNRGCILESQAEDANAIADYSRAIALDPQDAAAYFLRGRTYGNGFHYDRAIADYTRALRLAPDDAETYYRRGHAYEDGLHDHAAAIADYTASIRLDPDNPAAFHMRAIADRNAGRQADAEADGAAEKRLIATMPPARRFMKRAAGEWE